MREGKKRKKKKSGKTAEIYTERDGAVSMLMIEMVNIKSEKKKKSTIF